MGIMMGGQPICRQASPRCSQEIAPPRERFCPQTRILAKPDVGAGSHRLPLGCRCGALDLEQRAFPAPGAITEVVAISVLQYARTVSRPREGGMRPGRAGRQEVSLRRAGGLG